MLDTEDAQRRAALGCIGAQIIGCALWLATIGEIDMDGDHAAQHPLLRIGGNPRNVAAEILFAI